MPLPKADENEIKWVESRYGECYQAWLLVSRDGRSFQDAGNKLFPNDYSGDGRKAKARRRWESVEAELGRYHATTQQRAGTQKQELALKATGQLWPDSLWAAWLSPVS
jgi:hypothetical protein